MQIAQEQGFDAALNVFKSHIASGDIVYHNEYTGINVDKQFSQFILPYDKPKSSRFDAIIDKQIVVGDAVHQKAEQMSL